MSAVGAVRAPGAGHSPAAAREPGPGTNPHPGTGPVYVTGIGVAAPNGLGLEQYWEAVLAGRSGVVPITRFDTSRYPARLAGQIEGFDASAHLPSRLLPQTDVSTRLALAAADWAIADAGVDPSGTTDYDMGVVTSNGCGGFEFTHREFKKLWSVGPQAVSVYESFAWFYAVNTGQISIRNGMRGPSSALVAEQAGGLDALGHARRTVRRGTPLVVTGGVDSAFDPWGWLSHLSSGRISHATDPERAYLPFDAAACGYVPGEGGAILVVEDPVAARARGASRVYGEIAGYASTFDPAPAGFRGERPARPGRPPGLRRAAEQALAQAGLTPKDVDVVFADAAGVRDLDRAEATAIRELFGARRVPVTAPKALTGRLYAGGGPLDVATALLTIRDGVIPASGASADVPADYGIDLVTKGPREARVACALVLARGRWGFNSAVVVREASV
ncbi:ketosynthase chain-length factor [Streptomyces eurocidicus]|uniref:Act minimal PKS chain-length factor (CLF/KS beta) n=1 Tax=Streptomyces eurocidicus TaxID=66423 RepID=A0A7W8F0R8_STREU|nr:ketosynthase chain-length factor [Streptomyces eurocidicus]MBB5118908.1 act minimal PKS chain-length factor (CLF/KS beta) [Streptomyces eurocidicus]MBF6051286.1 ketosynthase chain-length factor [Streptomyces eurocidicus]